MSSDLVARLRESKSSLSNDSDSLNQVADAIQLLEAKVERYENALEMIRDQTFEHSNSPRLIDQLWHFVRWTKSVARDALEATNTREKKGSGSNRK
ncbi:MAG: hypothetical protein CMM56_02105 [Rhodospirillaceae bacterium]|nr:hypothetical protein [Gammaproteobacteria bacterium]MBH97225.1 hypothetical protein [Rhodospirillaceae bacterium]|tara:strand:- start:7868 stop:8155 length:288 start_codon:yes stop_codon:yes gene_type:complete